MTLALTQPEIITIVNRYIGVSDGYLGDLSYRAHREFYPEHCGIDIDPDKTEGTTRARFIAILAKASTKDQAKILRGVLARFPIDGPKAPATRTADLRSVIERIAARLEGGPVVGSPDLRSTSTIVDRAIADADSLLRTTGATSGVDRIHTALHGYLLSICEAEGLTPVHDSGEGAPSLTQLYRLLRERHPRFAPTGPRAEDIGKIIRAFSAALDALQPVRNQASVAHPNRHLLEGPEAVLVINAARTLLHYIDAKVFGL